MATPDLPPVRTGFELTHGGVNVLRGLSLIPEVVSLEEERAVCGWVLARCAEGRLLHLLLHLPQGLV